MKRIALATSILAAVMLSGCAGAASRGPAIASSAEISSPTGSVKTYEDETHKDIQCGELSLKFNELYVYHTVSDTKSNNTETFKCELDKGEDRQVKQVTISISEIKKPDLADTEGIISYMRDMFPGYQEITIFYNKTDDSGIIGIYSAARGELTDYVVCYQDTCYLVETDHISLLGSFAGMNQKRICGHYSTVAFYETIHYSDNKIEYEIEQKKDGVKYTAEASRSESNEGRYDFTLENGEGEPLLALSTYAPDINDVIKILDANTDGYADIQLLEQEGTLNNSYALYVWDASGNSFVRVKYDEMLSYFEVHNGYLMNWAKDDADSGVIQKLVWDKNTLIKVSEENYHAGQ